jgi:mannosyltransferase OCH1-like enzyme
MIPRRIHRIWLGPARMPEVYVAHARQWEALGWPVLDWSWHQLKHLPMSDETRAVLADLEENGANGGGGIETVSRWVQQADVLAYELIRCVGGVVVNCDIEPLRDLGPALEGLDGFVVAENETFLSNAVMGAQADHPLWVELCARLPGRFNDMRWQPMNQVTGPHFLTQTWKAMGEPVPKLQPAPFFPVSFDDERRIEVRPRDGFYVDHRWGHKHPELVEVDQWQHA